MKPTWIVETHIGHQTVDEMLKHLESNGYPHYKLRFVPFSYDVVGDEPKLSGPCIVYGGAGVAHYAESRRLHPGLWTSDLYAPTVYAEKLGEGFLNHLQIGCDLIDVPQFAQERNWSEFFMRPNSDLKQFAGRLFSLAEVSSWLDQLRNGSLLEDNNYRVVISPNQAIGREWRTVVVDGDVIDWSLYKANGRSSLHNVIEPEALQTVKRSIELFAPADVFIADVCETQAGMKIVEYNTFNSAGLYACNVGKVIDAVSDFVAAG